MMTLLRLGLGALALAVVGLSLFFWIINQAHPTHFPFGLTLFLIVVCGLFALGSQRR